MIKAISLLFLSIIFILNGCSYTSQSRSKSPYFDGVLKFNDEPVANAQIMLSLSNKDSFCHNAIQTTNTDENGQFNLKAAREQHSYTPFLNYELDEWVVCADYNNQRYTLYSNNRYDTGNVTGSVYLDCDLANRPLSNPCSVSSVN